MKVLKNVALSAIITLSLVGIAGCSKDDLATVKEGQLTFNKSITVGQALDGYKYFGQKEWQAVKTPEGARVVIFKADMNPQYIKELNEACVKSGSGKTKVESQKWSIQFTINKEGIIYVTGTQTLTTLADKTEKDGSLNEALLQSVYKNQLTEVCM